MSNVTHIPSAAAKSRDLQKLVQDTVREEASTADLNDGKAVLGMSHSPGYINVRMNDDTMVVVTFVVVDLGNSKHESAPGL
jgi:hypothetical protein